MRLNKLYAYTGGVAIVDNPFLCIDPNMKWTLLNEKRFRNNNQIVVEGNSKILCRKFHWVGCTRWLVTGIVIFSHQ